MRSTSLVSLLFAAAASVVASAPTTSLTLQIAIPKYLQQQPQSGQNPKPDAAATTKMFLASIPSWTRATLESGDATAGRHTYTSAPITAAGKLVFANVTAGSYLGEIHCATHVFSPLRVDIGIAEPAGTVDARVTETFRGNDWANQGEALGKVAADGTASTASSGPTFAVAPLTLATKSYYTARSTFNVLSLLKNPMILMAMFAMAMMFGMPYLMDSMDPEMKAEFEARQKQNPMGSILGGGGGAPGAAAPGAGFDMAAYLAGSGDKKQGGRK